MDFRILGPIEVVADGCSVELGGPLERALLGRLLVSAGRTVGLDQIVEDLWEDEAPDSARLSVRVRVSRLRTALSAAGCCSVITTQRPGYALSLAASDSLDAALFTSLADRGRAALRGDDPQGAARHLHDALALWRGPAFANVADVPYVRTEAPRREEERMSVLEDRIEADLALGRHGELVGELDALVADHPFRERLWAQRMLALYRCGRQAEALAAFQALRRTLVDELGIEPSRELRSLEARILHQDPDLAPARSEPLAPPAPAETTRPPLPDTIATSGAVTFVGREQEITFLIKLWEEAASGRLRTALLSGEPGIGKTSLASHVARRLFDRGATVLSGRCDEVGWVPYQPFVEVLRQQVGAMSPRRRKSIPGVERLSRLVPELAGDVAKAPPEDDPEVARYRFFEAVSSLLAEAALVAPLLLVVDDLQWADQPTLLLLRHVLRARKTSPIFVIGTYREADLTRTRPFADILAELRRERAFTHFPLHGLDEDEVVAVLEHAAQHDVGRRGRALAGALVATTEGNPFFIEQIVGHLVETGRVVRQEERWVLDRRVEDLGIPEGVREAVGRRLSRLSDSCNAALRAASVLGQRFEVDVLTRMMGCDPDDLLTSLEEALEAGLIRDLQVGGRPECGFSHALVQQALVDELPLARRQRLHLKAAAAIESAYAPRLETCVARLARHLGAAGTGADPEKAVDYSLRAMDAARRVLAIEEALEHGETALELMDENGADPARRALLLERIGNLRCLSDVDHERGVAALEEALEVLEAGGDDLRAARIHIRLGDALANYWPLVDVGRATHHLQAAQRLLGASPPPALAGPLAIGLTQVALYTMDSDSVETWSTRAMEIGRSSANEAVWSVGASYQALGLAYRGRLDEARDQVEEAWQVADRIDHLRAGFAAAYMASAWSLLNDPRETYRLLRRELDKPRQARAAGHRRILLVRARSALARAGDLAEAKRVADDSEWEHAELVPLALYSGDWDAAERILVEAIAGHRHFGASLYLGVRLQGLANLHSMQNRTETARTALVETVDIFGGRALTQELTARAQLALVEAGLGHHLEAAAELARCEAILVQGSGWCGGHLGPVALARGLVAATAGRLEYAERCFADAVDVGRRSCLPWDEAETLHHWGRALLAAGDHPRAAEKFAAAIDLYRRMGAGQAWIDRVLVDRSRAEVL